MSKTMKLDLLKKELEAFKSHQHTNQWYRNIILLMAEILVEENKQ